MDDAVERMYYLCGVRICQSATTESVTTRLIFNFMIITTNRLW